MLLSKLNKMKKIIDRTFIIEWGDIEKYVGDIQDYFGIDKLGDLCGIKIQLLHNVGSSVLNEEPIIITNIPKKNEYLKINISDLYINNNTNNSCQFLYKDNIIFSYNVDGKLSSLGLTYKILYENIFILFDDKMQIQYLIFKNISDFKFNKKKNCFNDEKSISLFFKVYTYNQDDETELLRLINEIELYLKEEDLVKNEICDLLGKELEFLKEELEDF